jgi:hypothetical protein
VRVGARDIGDEAAVRLGGEPLQRAGEDSGDASARLTEDDEAGGLWKGLPWARACLTEVVRNMVIKDVVTKYCV